MLLFHKQFQQLNKNTYIGYSNNEVMHQTLTNKELAISDPINWQRLQNLFKERNNQAVISKQN